MKKPVKLEMFVLMTLIIILLCLLVIIMTLVILMLLLLILLIADGLICSAVCVVDGSVADDGACCHDNNCENGDCTDEVCVGAVEAICGNGVIEGDEECDGTVTGCGLIDAPYGPCGWGDIVCGTLGSNGDCVNCVWYSDYNYPVCPNYP
jgi:hypothetical protein